MVYTEEVTQTDELILKKVWMDQKVWRKLLNSDKGLFRKVSSSGIAGVQLNFSTGKIAASLGLSEINCFERHASVPQKDFFDRLLGESELAAMEYVFKITGAYEIWKGGIKKILSDEEDDFHAKEIFQIKKKYPFLFNNVLD